MFILAIVLAFAAVNLAADVALRREGAR